MCAGRQALWWFFHGYGPGLIVVNRYPRPVRQAATHAGEVRVDRRRVLIPLVDVAAGRIRLPDLDQLTDHRATLAVHDPAGDDHPLADRLAVVLDRQIRLQGVHIPLAEARRPSSIVSGSACRRSLVGCRSTLLRYGG